MANSAGTDGWYSDDQVDRIVLDAVRASRGAPVELADIFERIDFSERWVPAHPILDASFGRLGRAGRIRRVGTGYVDGERSPVGGPVDGLAEGEYVSGLRRYHAEFARDSERFFRNPIVRALTARWADPDRAAIEYAVERVVAPAGGRVGRSTLRGDILSIAVDGLDHGTDVEALVLDLRSAVAPHGRGPTRIVVRFDRGPRHEIR
jgi:hypothetical protein